MTAFLYVACLGPQKTLFPPQTGQPSKTIYVVNQGWHTGIIFFRADVNDSIWSAIGDFSDAQFVEVGWGDAAFYQAEDNTVWLGMKALFWPTASVLHVAGFDMPVEQYFTGYKIYRVTLSDRGYLRLCAFIDEVYARDGQGEVIALGEGLYGKNSRFYKAKGKYFMTKTCNNWAAIALRKAGCPITPFYSCTAGNLLYQIGKFGRKVDDGS